MSKPKQLDVYTALEQRRDAVVAIWEHCRDTIRNDAEKCLLDDVFMRTICELEQHIETARDIIK